MADRPTASSVTDPELDALYADLERARDVAVQLENDNRRLEHEQEGLLKTTAKLINDVGYARHTLAREVLGWAEAREDMDLPQTVVYAVGEHRSDHARAARLEQQLDAVRALHTRDEDADYCTVCSNHGDVQWPCRTVAALDGAQQPETAGDRLILGDRTLPVLNHWRTQGPTSDGREKWGVVTQQPELARQDGHTGAQRPGCIVNGTRYHCGTDTCPCPPARAIAAAELEQLRTELALLHEGEEPHPEHTVIETPAQWIYRWNRVTPEQRLAGAEQAIRDALRAGRCFLENHVQRLAAPAGAEQHVRGLDREQLHQAIRELARTDPDWWHQQLRRLARIDGSSR